VSNLRSSWPPRCVTGPLVRKRYHAPATPCQRLMADPRTNMAELRAWLRPSHGKHRESYWSGCRLSAPVPTRTDNCGHCSVASRYGAEKPVHQMVFGTMTSDPGLAASDDERTLVSNVANSYPSDCQGGAKSPVDLPLRLEDAAASPTTPQGQHQ
jgi:hypothetical protein